ncbi:hypothetical protein LTR37_020586 [Vermiconidia calcicola]|uniref:Uncharacterized protein n=1 Tax=Vermiconidia calcicola TaxID=1690605 RepID=A0ACC3MC24_9PEZI|nr:hypothetical protein LTR37_020586 [Vermiconidia calcicola]
MGFTNKTHWIGAFLLFLASILLLITTISAPIINHVGLLRVTLANETNFRHSSVSFGTFGYCILDVPPVNTQQAWCTGRHIGYDPDTVMARIDSVGISVIEAGTAASLTRVMVLHPIACGFAFIAFLCSLGAGIIGSLAGALVAFLAWVLTLIALATDFMVFGIVRHHVNDDPSGSRARFGSAIWCLVGALIALFLGMLIVFFTCFAARREKKRAVKHEQSTPAAATPRRKRFGIF